MVFPSWGEIAFFTVRLANLGLPVPLRPAMTFFWVTLMPNLGLGHLAADAFTRCERVCV